MSFCATNFQWSFGDGNTSTDSLPVHQYTDTGHYQATLIACKGLICDTIKKTIYVDIVGNPDPAWTVYQSNDTVFYTLSNYIPYELVNWYFGDGGSDTLHQSYHVFATPGSYYVNLLVRGLCGMQIHDTTLSFTFTPFGISTNTELNTNINIYPNPSSEIITIEASSPIIEKIVLFDILGNSLFIEKNKKPEKINEINVSSFSSGQYFMQVRTKEGVSNKKIIVR